MNATLPTESQSQAPSDPRQKKRLILGVLVWVVGWCLALVLVPIVRKSGLPDAVKATINSVLLLGFPKLFLVLAVAIMGKPGFAYLKSLIMSHIRRLAPPATVSPLRYNIGLVIFVGVILLSSVGRYINLGAVPLRHEHPRLVAMAGDALLLISLFLLGGDFWDKLRALFVRDARVIFPAKSSK